ncbi:indigoidine synthase A-like protein [Medicago truncatula]|uniref:Indigoidine synthase A-like protein n=1 Tax=Medicago truncatula TaxID=3880 RepID=G7JLY3_MEDTR|nr:indigoidine synthase A-like protein [Medicago truncatula]
MTSSAALRINNIRRHFDSDNTVNKPTEVNAAGASSINVKVASEVSEALSLGRAVVALESTIISHGMPYPQNLQTAKEVEGIVKKNGAVPATIAILDGVPIVGLSGEELERLATLGPRAQKTARRDIAYVVARGGNGATTVSATMFLASMVGIHVFVTGGIGGVHRHGEYRILLVF